MIEEGRVEDQKDHIERSVEEPPKVTTEAPIDAPIEEIVDELIDEETMELAGDDAPMAEVTTSANEAP
jgi:redox-regulated HSP33 family molecular chaperone